MNRRDLLKSFGAAGVAITLPKATMAALPDTPIEKQTATAAQQTIPDLVAAADEILLDLNKMAVISINAQTDNNIRIQHTVGSLETYPTMGMCERFVEVQCYVDENIRALFNELRASKVRVFYRQPKHPHAEVQPDDPVMIDSMAILDTLEIQVHGAAFDAEASLVLRLV